MAAARRRLVLSRDIDLIVNSPALRSTLRETLDDYSENPNIGDRKVRGTIDGVHIDAYLPYESELGGKLRLKVDVLAQHVEPEPIKHWILLNPEAHTISKMAALIDRPNSPKGSKDAKEIIAMLVGDGEGHPSIDSHYAVTILLDATAGPAADVPGHIAQVFQLLPVVAKANKKERRVLDTIGKQWLNDAKDQTALRVRSTTHARFTSSPTRRKNTGEPGNGGKFSNRGRPDGEARLR